MKHTFFRWLLLSAALAGCEPRTTQQPTTPPPPAAQRPLPPPPDTALLLLTYGMPPPAYYQSAARVAGGRWGVRYQSVAGCEVTESLLDSVARHNAAVARQLVRLHGPDWRATLDREEGHERRRQQIARALLDREPRVVAWQRALARDSSALFYTFVPTDTAHYEVAAQDWRYARGRWTKRIYLRYGVDVGARQLTLRSDRVVIADTTSLPDELD